MFFEFAQTNYSYVDEQTVRRKVNEFYSSSLSLGIEDAPWVCIVLMIFAVGTQFAHLDKVHYGGLSGEDAVVGAMLDSTDDALALVFYRKATFLIPDMMTLASLESVQAFILLGVYTLPVDPGGLSCTYFGIAIRLATQNGMHLKRQRCRDRIELELRSRIWWTACTLER